MTINRSKPSHTPKSTLRPSLLITLRLTDKEGYPLDEQAAWDHLVQAFETHPYLRVSQATIRPDKESDS